MSRREGAGVVLVSDRVPMQVWLPVEFLPLLQRRVWTVDCSGLWTTVEHKDEAGRRAVDCCCFWRLATRRGSKPSLRNGAQQQAICRRRRRTQSTTMTSETEAKGIVQGNWTPMWVVCTLYMLFFVIYLGFREFGDASVAFVLHTLVAWTFILACAWNLFHTPSHGGWYRQVHRWTGWTAVASGTFVVASGYWIVLKDESSLSTMAQNLFLGTGALQVLMQVFMVYFIRRQRVFLHIVSANVLFYTCAFLPALNRLPNIVGFEDFEWWPVIIAPVGVALAALSIYSYAKTAPKEEALQEYEEADA